MPLPRRQQLVDRRGMLRASAACLGLAGFPRVGRASPDQTSIRFGMNTDPHLMGERPHKTKPTFRSLSIRPRSSIRTLLSILVTSVVRLLAAKRRRRCMMVNLKHFNIMWGYSVNYNVHVITSWEITT